jgi:hypothetical protein
VKITEASSIQQNNNKNNKLKTHSDKKRLAAMKNRNRMVRATCR